MMSAFMFFTVLNAGGAVFFSKYRSKTGAETFITNEKTGVKNALTVTVITLLFLWFATYLCAMIMY